MSDPINDIFNGTPDGIDDEELKQMQAESDMRQADLAASMQQEEQEGGTTASPSQPTEQQPTEQQPKAEKKEEGKTVMGAVLDSTAAATMLPLAAQDAGVDLINLIPGVNIPKIPKFNSDTLQATREIASVVLPTVGLSMVGAGPVAGAAQASKVRWLADPAVGAVGKAAWGLGTGALVDYSSSTSEGDNLTGTLKQNYPRTWGWIPDDIATLEDDAPDVKRLKNTLEGMGLGVAVDVIGNLGRIAKGIGGSAETARWLPEAEKGKSIFKDANNATTDSYNVSAGRRSDALDEVGEFNVSQLPRKGDVPDIQEPVFGLHDMYGYSESGIRSVDDMGAISGRVDIARITDNIDTIDGRVSNMVSDAVIKFANNGGAEYSQLVEGLGDQITAAGRYGYVTGSGKTISADQIDLAMDNFVESMGGMKKADLEAAIAKLPRQELKGEIGKAFRALIDYDQQQANTLLQASLSGQISDTAKGIRLTSGSGSIDRGLDQILDRMELLITAHTDTRLNEEALKRFNNELLDADGVRNIAASKDQMLKQAQREAKNTVDSLREIKAVRPDLLEPMMLAYDLTNGNVKTVAALNDYWSASTGVLKKAVVDGNPDVPSVVMKGWWATVYNNVLSGFGSPLKAAASNSALLLEKQFSTFAGAMITGDKYTQRRALFQLQNMGTNLRNGFEHMQQVFKNSGLDPDYGGQLGREGYMLKNQQQMDVLQSYADAAAARGDFGPQYMMEQIQAINDVAYHPLLRLGNRSMMALDGFLQAFMASQEARGRAFDALQKGAVTADMLEAVQKQTYDSMFRPDMMGRKVLTDDAVRKASGELAFNLDNKATNSVSELIKRAPALKPFLLFTRTPINALKFAASHSPMGLFFDQLNEFGRKFDEVPLEKMEQLLANRGIPFDENAEIAYNAIRAELKGRKAIGTLAVTGAVGLFMNDSITGDGIADRRKMALRREAGWKPRSIKLPTGQWVSYDGIPGVSDWLSVAANIMDNYDTLGDGDTAQLLHAMAFTIGASFTDKTGLTNVEPFFDVLRLNPKAVNKWAAGFLPSATITGSSQINELSKLLSPNLKVVDDNLAAMMANRTPLKAGLPDEYDWIDGGKVGEPGNFFSRLVNVYSPFKINGKVSEAKQFLQDIEFDARPSLTMADGVQLTPPEQSRVASLIGEQGYFKSELKRIMSSKNGKRFRAEYQAAQRRGADINLKDFQNLHSNIQSAMDAAVELAKARLDQELGGAISQRQYEHNLSRYHSRTGDVDAILSIPK